MPTGPSPQLPQSAPRPNTGLSSLRTIVALMLREMSSRYGRSPGGYLWALLEPLGAIIILGVGFSLLSRSPPLGTSFLLFYATGYLPFNSFTRLSNKIAHTIGFSKPLLMYPRVTWMDAVFARFFLNSLTDILVGLILISSILMVSDTRTVLQVAPILTGVGMALALGFSVGLLNLALFGLAPLWTTVWSIATRPLFLASGIFFTYESMPQSVQAILWYNPLIHIVALVRSGFYPSYHPDYVSMIYLGFWAVVPATMGLILLGRYHRDILNR